MEEEIHVDRSFPDGLKAALDGTTAVPVNLGEQSRCSVLVSDVETGLRAVHHLGVEEKTVGTVW
jgi:hypothetical protein